MVYPHNSGLHIVDDGQHGAFGDLGFLANVNLSSGSLYVVVRPSVCLSVCLSVVCL